MYTTYADSTIYELWIPSDLLFELKRFALIRGVGFRDQNAERRTNSQYEDG